MQFSLAKYNKIASKSGPNMNLTVIIPSYNSADVMEKCLTSLLNQKGNKAGDHFEIIVVDDGSTDKTVEIAHRFPVTVVTLVKNQGRIVARLAGAKAATTKKILFIDTRVTLPENFLISLEEFKNKAAVIGETHSPENKYHSLFDTVFYLVRRKYYGKNMFPLKDLELQITRENFKRAPKGTAVLFIDRELFIKLTPNRIDRNVNDDTLLFHNLVDRENIPLLRTKKLFFNYSQRVNLKKFIPWLFDRGTRFADFYFRPKGYLFIPFIVIIFLLFGNSIGIIVSFKYYPEFSLFLFVLPITAFIGVAIYLSENIRDLFTLLLVFPFILFVFSAGVCKYFVLSIRSFFQRS